MSTPVTYVANQYNVPAYQDTGYAQGTGNLSSYLIALATGSLTLSGGNFTLTADVNFGANFGLKSLYYKSRNATVASTGIIRLGSAEMICWRDNLDTADLELTTNASDQLTYNGLVIATSTGALNGTTLTLSATSNQMVIGTTNTTTVSFTAPAASRVYTVPDVLGAANFILSAGAQTITGAKTFTSSTLLLQEVSSTDVVTIAVAALAASRIYTVPDAGGAADFVMTAGAQTIGGQKTLSAATLFASGTVSLPGISFSGDTDSGLFRTGADDISLATGGAAHVSINAAGEVGLGPTAVSLATCAVNIEQTVTGSNMIFRIGNNKTGDLASGAQSLVFVGDGTAGDPFSRWAVGSGGNWSAGIDNSDGDSWCLTNGTGMTGTNIVRATTTGGFQIAGTTTNDAGAAGFVGQYIESIVGATNVPATTTYGDLTSISLTAGDWDVTAQIEPNNNGGTWTRIEMGISTTSGNSSSGLSGATNSAVNIFASSSTTPTFLALSVPNYRMSLNATTTVYLKYSATFSAGTPQSRGRISARRVR